MRIADLTHAAGYAADRMRRAASPPVLVTKAPEEIVFERDVEIVVRDGTTLRVNVFRPPGDARRPVLMSAHPYGKDNIPANSRSGKAVPMQYRALRQPKPLTFSEYTAWEAPDPAYWVPRGYVVVNCDLRGYGHSDGSGTIISDQDARDYFDMIEWVAAQRWSTGRVGLLGVSYLAISQYKVAALRPPHLVAICPWEGLSDAYRDLMRPGGIREHGFISMWIKGLIKEGPPDIDIEAALLEHDRFDDFWAAMLPDLEAIEAPVLICGSFSDQNLHTQGSFRVFERIGSRQKWMYTHRGGKWATFYSQEALAEQNRFFDHFLAGATETYDAAPVRLEVHDTGDTVHEVRGETSWPVATTEWTPLYLASGGNLTRALQPETGTARFSMPDGTTTFDWTIPFDLEITGPMALRLWLEVEGNDDVNLFVVVRKFRNGREITFEGSYGYGNDAIAKGWLAASHRELDTARSRDWYPEHTHRRRELLQPRQVVQADIAIRPSATFMRTGDLLRLEVAARWPFPTNPVFGSFPAEYDASGSGTCILHFGGRRESRLLVPIVNPRTAIDLD